MSRRAANRWPAFIAIVVMLVIYALTPQNMVPRAVMIVIASLIFIALIAVNPVHTGKQSTVARWLAVILALLLMVSNLVDVVFIVRDLIAGRGLGPIILLEAFEVWVANVIAFSIVYWEIDRGGPVGRATLLRSQLQALEWANKAALVLPAVLAALPVMVGVRLLVSKVCTVGTSAVASMTVNTASAALATGLPAASLTEAIRS